MNHAPNFKKYSEWFEAIPGYTKMLLEFWKPLNSFLKDSPMPE